MSEPKRRGRPPLPPEARKAPTSGPSGKPREPTEAEREAISALVADLRALLATSPEACGRSRLSEDGLLQAPQAMVAEVAKIQPGDLSAALNGRRPRGLSVATILERLRALTAGARKGQ